MTNKQRTLVDEARMLGRFTVGLRRFFSEPLELNSCLGLLDQFRGGREASFLQLVRKAVYDHPSSPYLPLFQDAGIDYVELERMVNSNGIEHALGRCFDEGIYVTLDEFKGRKPIVRNGREIEVPASGFDNPFLKGHFEGSTGGSTGVGRRLLIDLDLLHYDAVAHGVFLRAFGIEKYPFVIWRPQAPGAAGTKKALIHAKLGLPVARWFSQNRTTFLSGPKPFLFGKILTRCSRFWGPEIPHPEYAPMKDAQKIARWLSQQPREPGFAIHFDTNVSSGLRICLAAQSKGLPIEHTFFRLGGEPLTAAKLKRFRDLGTKATCHYSMAEVGPIGMACADPAAADDVHLRYDKVALITRPVELGSASVPAFHLTSLLPACPKILINVATGDCGEARARSCGCLFDRVGYNLHLSEIRSYEKLTTEGMNFLGADLYVLTEEILPESFGGGPTDYQLVERESAEGLTRIDLRVSQRVGAIDEAKCLRKAHEFLASRAPENRMMIERLREDHSLRLVREEPLATSASKILTLHTYRSQTGDK